ncbi:PH domain-containing protein [Haloferax sp. AS1]|uniref:PH domain-containing protein n=1 Tax=Haloferax sp. AS1 TaxID=2562277 RepID=UPI00165ECB08|nr:PH domain-containing protein [Haloferax sp. AS1]MBC9986817.1 PH domain-containing protein [Haloferax sp. AS1]
MARGLPALWSSVFGLPLVAAGAYLSGFVAELSGGSPSQSSPAAGLIISVFGLFILAMGWYVHFVTAPETPQMRADEHLVEARNPAQRSALAEAALAVPLLSLGGYLLYFTHRPLYQPTIAFGGGLFLFSRGIYRYWQNTLTTYSLTNQRIIEEYRFISLLRNEVPLEKARGVEETRSAWDSLFGLGNVRIRSGASGGLTVAVEQVYDPADFAGQVRRELSSGSEQTAAAQEPTAEARADGVAPPSADAGAERERSVDSTEPATGDATDSESEAVSADRSPDTDETA